MSADVDAWGVAISSVLIVAAVAVSWRMRLRLGAQLVAAAVRALVQLLVVGAALGLVLDPDAPLALAWGWVAVILVMATVVVVRRVPESPGGAPVAAAALGVSAAVSLAVLFGLRVFPLEARTLVPLSGMAVGNAMAAAVLASRRLVEEITDHRDRIEVRLALGLTGPDAVRPHIRRALTAAWVPQLETTRTVGLVALPGAMTGLILAGTSAVDAVLVQVVVMYLVLGAVAITSTAVAVGLSRRVLTADHRLSWLPRAPAGGR